MKVGEREQNVQMNYCNGDYYKLGEKDWFPWL